MKTREIKALLRSVPAGNCEGLEQVLPLCREAYGKRRRLRRLRTSETVLRQLRFVALPVWLVQGAVLLAVSLMLGGLSGAERSASLVPGCSAASAVLVALTLLPFHGRGKRYRMDEVEAATRVSGAKLLLARFAAVGAGDAVCLSVIALLTLKAAPGTALTLIALPFALTGAVSLAALNHLPDNSGTLAAAGFGLTLSALYWSMADRLVRLSLGAALAICLLSLAVLAAECVKMARDARFGNYTEEFQWN